MAEHIAGVVGIVGLVVAAGYSFFAARTTFSLVLNGTVVGVLAAFALYAVMHA